MEEELRESPYHTIFCPWHSNQIFFPKVYFTCPTSLSLGIDKRGFFAGYELSGCWAESCLERIGEWEGAIGILWPLPPQLSIVHSHQDWRGLQTQSQSLTITCSVNTSIPNKQLNFLHFGPIFLWKCFMYFPAPKKEMNVLKLSHNRKILRFTSTVFSSSFPIRRCLFSQSFDVFP